MWHKRRHADDPSQPNQPNQPSQPNQPGQPGHIAPNPKDVEDIFKRHMENYWKKVDEEREKEKNERKAKREGIFAEMLPGWPATLKAALLTILGGIVSSVVPQIFQRRRIQQDSVNLGQSARSDVIDQMQRFINFAGLLAENHMLSASAPPDQVLAAAATLPHNSAADQAHAQGVYQQATVSQAASNPLETTAPFVRLYHQVISGRQVPLA